MRSPAPTKHHGMASAAAIVLGTSVALTLTLLGGCSDPSSGGVQPADASADHPGCTLGFLGTEGQPTQLKLLVLGPGGTSTEIADGARVPLIRPIQGGRVVFVGAKATNIGACSVKLTGSVRDTTTQQVRVDARTVNLEPTGDGWGASVDTDASSFSNIPLCANQWASTDVYENPFELTLSLDDGKGHTASTTIHVVPFCGPADGTTPPCACECKKGYILGQACGVDAGP